MAWYEALLARVGGDPLAQPFEVRPDAARIERAIASDYPSIALGAYEHYYTVALFEHFCADLARRAAEHARTRLKPLPSLALGFVPPAESLPEARVHAIMGGIDVPRTLGLA